MKNEPKDIIDQVSSLKLDNTMLVTLFSKAFNKHLRFYKDNKRAFNYIHSQAKTHFKTDKFQAPKRMHLHYNSLPS